MDLQKEIVEKITNEIIDDRMFIYSVVLKFLRDVAEKYNLDYMELHNAFDKSFNDSIKIKKELWKK